MTDRSARNAGTPVALFALLPLSLLCTLLAFVWHLSWWSLLVCFGLLLMVAGLFARVRGARSAKPLLLAGALVFAGPFLLRAIVARGAGGVRVTTLPGDRGTRLVNTLVPERDGVLVAAGLLGLSGGLDDEEGREFHSILERAYDRIETPALRLPTPAIATYLGLESPSGFDAIVIPAQREPSNGAVLFLHGYGGGFYAYCSEIARAAQAANLLTICPSFDATGAWWTPKGKQTALATVDYLHAQGVTRIYLAGLSNGGAGAAVLLTQSARQFQGFILISGTRAEPPPSLPGLVIQGSRDRMMPASFARAYAERSAQVRYRELSGGHLVFLSRHERVRAEIGEFLREHELAR